MKPKRFTEEQVIGILREQEAGLKTGTWRKFGGMDVSDAKRLNALEYER